METIVKSSEVTQTKRVLSVREVEELKKIAAVYDASLGANESGYVNGSLGSAPVSLPGLRGNRPRLNEQQKQIVETLRNHSPEPISAKERDAYLRRADFCKTKFEDVLQTRREIHALSRQDPAWFTAMDKAKAWQSPCEGESKTPQDYAEEYRYIKRRLEPENAEADSLDRLRKDR